MLISEVSFSNQGERTNLHCVPLFKLCRLQKPAFLSFPVFSGQNDRFCAFFFGAKSAVPQTPGVHFQSVFCNSRQQTRVQTVGSRDADCCFCSPPSIIRSSHARPAPPHPMLNGDMCAFMTDEYVAVRLDLFRAHPIEHQN